MSKSLGRFLIALITFGIGITIACFPACPATYSKTNAQGHQRLSRERSSEILSVLMPNGVWGDASQLDRFPRVEMIKALRTAEGNANGERAMSIAFLLAALREDYLENKRKLLNALKECRRRSYPQVAQCADYISAYLMELSRRGDFSLLRSLFEVSDLADGAFSQSLGGFYSDTLKEHPEQFLKAVARYPKKQQRAFCSKAGSEDGSGMDEDRFRQVKKLLNEISAREKGPLSSAAKNCLISVEESYLEVLKATRYVPAK